MKRLHINNNKLKTEGEVGGMSVSDGEFSCEAIVDFDENVVRAILVLETLFPEKIKDEEEKIIQNLQNPLNINIIMKKGGQIVGYALAIPHNDALDDLIGDDPEMMPDPHRYYIDKISMLPDLRKGLSFLRMVNAIFEEARKFDIHRVSSHVLCVNGLDRIIARMFGKKTTLKRYTCLPSYGDALCMYVDVTFDDS